MAIEGKDRFQAGKAGDRHVAIHPVRISLQLPHFSGVPTCEAALNRPTHLQCILPFIITDPVVKPVTRCIPPVLVFALLTPSTDFALGHTRIIDQCPLGVKWECSQAINHQKREAHGHMFYLPSVVSLRLLMAMAGCFDLSLPVGYNSHSYSDID